MDYVGAKVALFCKDQVLCYLRDNKPGLRWAAMWDLPGGGREDNELPEACLLRELDEEFGLQFTQNRLIWRRVFQSITDASRPSVFFAGRISQAEIATIRFGDEGQGWAMMGVSDYVAHPNGIPEMQRRTALAWAECQD